MTVEAATYLSQLDPSAPDGSSQQIREGDDHLRLVKSVLINSFPAVAGAVTVSHVELNLLDGFTYLGSAAAKDAGEAAGNVCLLQDVGGVAGLPTLDGSNLINVNTTDQVVADIELRQTRDGMAMAYYFGSA